MLQAVERWHAEISQLIHANLQASMAQVGMTANQLCSTRPIGDVFPKVFEGTDSPAVISLTGNWQ